MWSKLGKIVLNIGYWFIESSKDTTKLSTTFAGLVSFGVLMGLDSTLLSNLNDEVINTVVLGGQIITLAVSAYGLLRKLCLTTVSIYKSVKGTE
jgi:hypothetical protein